MTASSTTPSAAATTATARSRKALHHAATAWFVAVAAGQVLFILFIALFYYPPTLAGDFAAWNTKPLVEGFKAGDQWGNLGFAAHVLMAAVMTACGLVQLIPAIRRKAPQLHRWSGRIFLVLAMALALGGLGLVVLRGSWLTLIGAIAISLDAVLICITGWLAWRDALRRDFAAHRRWALRCFILASGVWQMRVGYIIWGATTGGLGIADGMRGPFDLFWGFGCYLLPLALLELYLRIEAKGKPASRWAMTVTLALAALLIAGGSAGAWLAMWGPYI